MIGPDPSRPVNSFKNQTLKPLSEFTSSVSASPQRSPIGHHFDTSWSLNVTNKFGTHECKAFRKEIFDQFEPLSACLTHEYLELARHQSYVEANRRLQARSSQLQINDLNLTDSEASLKALSRKNAQNCLNLTAISKLDTAHRACVRHALSYQLDLSPMFHDNPHYCLNRVSDETWWYRAIRKLRNRRLSEIERDIGIISKFKSPYSSKRSTAQRRISKLKNREFLERTHIQNHNGQKYSLAELSDKSVSDPANRRAELMTRISGFEKVALASDHLCFFHTLTTPSRMHRCLTKTVSKNPKFDGTTPREAQNYLRMVWARTRAAFARASIRPYGFRISEPHHDGTPHWHFMLFVPADKAKEMNDIMKKYALDEDGDEKGATKFRFKSIEIDMSKGSAAGYIAKYVSKSIDGKHLEEDLLGNPANEAAEKIETWSRDHGLRQFQQIGGAPVTVWRELRRIKEALADDAAEKARTAADVGDWAAYTFAMGGIEYSRDSSPIRPLYKYLEAVDLDTGVVTSFSANKYNELKALPIRGLYVQGLPHITRQFAWSSNRRLIPTDATNFGDLDNSPGRQKSAGLGGPWTRVNNCTKASEMPCH